MLLMSFYDESINADFQNLRDPIVIREFRLDVDKYKQVKSFNPSSVRKRARGLSMITPDILKQNILSSDSRTMAL